LAVQNTFLPSCLPDSKTSRSSRIANEDARSPNLAYNLDTLSQLLMVFSRRSRAAV
jgi:hypothetical protein